MNDETVVGIDLGTTHSSVCVLSRGAEPELVAVDGATLMPSVVARAHDGQLLVGRPALNLWMAAPDRVIRSAKRRMGEDVALPLGDETMTPVEVSATILRRLKLAAEAHLGHPVERAVITVPAYFADAQRAATREAGAVAGFDVARVLNEPTAASLCYGDEEDRTQTRLVYDLGGGTFDVSVVRTSRGVTEVLASRGDPKLGGDDFDRLLMEHLEAEFEARHGTPISGLRARARLRMAAEAAKIALSTEGYTRVMEEALVEADGLALNLDVELSRATYEALIEPLLEQTRRSVQAALRDVGLLARDLDDVLLVGGASRTPLVRSMLRAMLGREPRMDVDPDRAVALGAGIQAARVAGSRGARILVDVTPYTFGVASLGEVNGAYGPNLFHPVIRRNTPLPARQIEVLYTSVAGQTEIDVKVLQGEDEDVRNNTLVGRFMVEGLDPDAEVSSPVVFEFRLDLDGILEVTVTERHTGLVKRVTIKEAFHKLSDNELDQAKVRVAAALEDLQAVFDEPSEGDTGSTEGGDDTGAAEDAVVTRARRLLGELDEEEDRAEIEELLGKLDGAPDEAARAEALTTLSDVLFYLE